MNFDDLDAQLAALQAELKSDIKKVNFILFEIFFCVQINERKFKIK